MYFNNSNEMNLQKRIAFLFVALLTTLTLTLHAQGFLKTEGKYIVNDKGEKIIFRGMGLGGWMLQEGYMLRVQGIGQQQHVVRAKLNELAGKEQTDAFYKAWLANNTRKIDIDSLKAWGFNAVRLPMHYNLYTLPIEEEPTPGQQTWLEQGFVMTDNLLQWCKENKIYLILDLHGAPGGQGNDNNISDRDPSKPSLWQSEANQQKMVALWRKLAARYANEPWIGAYDIINEPNWGFEKPEDKNGCGETVNAPLKKLMMDITNAIREVDKNHIVVIEGNCWGNNYNGILPPWDKNMLISFHKYWNYNDQASISRMLDFREQYQTPVWLGETGENSNVWFRDAIHLMESNDIGWTWWPLKKLGANNPLEVKVPADYQKIIDFWAKRGPQPTPAEASKGLTELANNIKLENTIYHPDVIDAMFRQPHTDATKPFKPFTVKAGATLKAVDYDLGRNRFAYYDKDTANYWVSTGGKHTDGNRGHAYRNDGVDITQEPGSAGNYFVDHIETDEWLQYTVKATRNGAQPTSFVVASEDAGGKISVVVNGVPYKKEIVVQATAGKWQAIEVKDLVFKKGENVIRVKAVAGGYTFKGMTFK
jgi:hypothetical protein